MARTLFWKYPRALREMIQLTVFQTVQIVKIFVQNILSYGLSNVQMSLPVGTKIVKMWRYHHFRCEFERSWASDCSVWEPCLYGSIWVAKFIWNVICKMKMQYVKWQCIFVFKFTVFHIYVQDLVQKKKKIKLGWFTFANRSVRFEAALCRMISVWHHSTARARREQTDPYAFE